MKGQYHQWRLPVQPEAAAAGAAAVGHHSMPWVVAVVVVAAALPVTNALLLAVDRKTEAFVEGVGLRDMVHVQRAVGAVGRSEEAGEGGAQEPLPVPEWKLKQGGLN